MPSVGKSDSAVQWRVGVSVQFADRSPRSSGNDDCRFCIGTRDTNSYSRDDEDGCTYEA